MYHSVFGMAPLSQRLQGGCGGVGHQFKKNGRTVFCNSHANSQARRRLTIVPCKAAAETQDAAQRGTEECDTVCTGTM